MRASRDVEDRTVRGQRTAFPALPGPTNGGSPPNEEALALTSRGLELPVYRRPSIWDTLRQTGAVGLGLWDATRPRLLSADSALCRALGRTPGALDDVAVSDIELHHPFAWSVEAWRRHLRTIQTFGRVEWPTWLLPANAVPVHATLRLGLVELEGTEYLL